MAAIIRVRDKDGNVTDIPAIVGPQGPAGKDGSDASVTAHSICKALGYTAVNPDKLSLAIHTDGLLYIFVDGQPVGNGVPMAGGGDVVGWVDSANNIVVSGNLADGNYTVKYEMENGDVIDIGELVLGAVTPDEPEVPEATNYFDASTALLNHRLGSSGIPSAYDGMVVTDFIPLNDIPTDAIFHYSGVTLVNSSNYSYLRRTVWYDANKSKIAEDNSASVTEGANLLSPAQPASGGAIYIRIAMVLRDNEPIAAGDVANLRITLE